MGKGHSEGSLPVDFVYLLVIAKMDLGLLRFNLEHIWLIELVQSLEVEVGWSSHAWMLHSM